MSQTAACAGVRADGLPGCYAQLLEELPFALAWHPGVVDLPAWQAAGRAKLQALTLQDWASEPDLALECLSEVDQGDHLACRLAFAVRPGCRTEALLLRPKTAGPHPAVLLLHDHGAQFAIGKEKLIAPWDDEAALAVAHTWQARYFAGRAIGQALVARGYVVLAVDALGWGSRGGLTYDAQQALAANLFNLGSSLAGMMAREDARAAVLLASLADVDATRVATLGFSMGGFRAWQLAALSGVIRATVSVCWMGTARGLMQPGGNQLKGQSAFHMTHPGLFQYLDYPDVASLAAPRPMLCMGGGADRLFPETDVALAFARLHEVWRAYGAESALHTQVWPGLGHEFSLAQQEAAFTWLDQALAR